jgi:hypothetical protein
MDFVHAIQLAALRDVLNQRQRNPVSDPDFFQRHVMRWYSKTFFTPLDQVEQLPLVDILRAFFEERYENMKEEDLEQERADLLKTDEDRQKDARQKDQAEYDMYDAVLWAKRSEELARKRKTEKEKRKTMRRQGLQVDDPTPKSGLNAGLSRQAELVSISDLKVLKQAPESVSISFVSSEDELDLDRDSLGLLAPPKPPPKG